MNTRQIIKLELPARAVAGRAFPIPGKFSRALHAQEQQGVPVLWVEVEPDYASVLPQPHALKEITDVILVTTVETGRVYERRDVRVLDYAGTVQMNGGSYVLHVFCGQG